MLARIGHDIQTIDQVAQKEYIKKDGLFFTHSEVSYIESCKNSESTIAGLFSAKEAFFKAISQDFSGFLWSDIEVLHKQNFAPYYNTNGSLRDFFIRNGWSAHLSISHTSHLVSTIALIVANSSN
jgi:holo-[acyl-carrier protein] synthase